MNLLEVQPLDLGPDVKAIGLELIDPENNREPIQGKEAAAVWGRVLGGVGGKEVWGLDFFSHVDRVRNYCEMHGIEYREAGDKVIMVPAMGADILEGLLQRFENETFGVRAGEKVVAGDAALEGELARRGIDAYHSAYGSYLYCGICDFENGSMVLLSNKLWASEVTRRIKRVMSGLEVEVRLPS